MDDAACAVGFRFFGIRGVWQIHCALKAFYGTMGLSFPFTLRPLRRQTRHSKVNFCLLLPSNPLIYI